jgi:hypothetical protein
VTWPVVNGKQNTTTLTVINHARRSYGQQQAEYSITGGANAPESPDLGLGSSPSEVRGVKLAETALGLLAEWDRQRPGQPAITASRAPAEPVTWPDAARVSCPVTIFAISW